MSFLDEEFQTFIPNVCVCLFFDLLTALSTLQMTCLSVLDLPFESRCMMVRKLPDCKNLINAVNYFEIMCCTLHIKEVVTEILVMLLFMFFVIVYVMVTATIVGTYLAPVMKILSVRMHMNEYFAGITLLSFTNSFPDLMSNMMPIRAQSALFTRTISNALVIVLVCGGMVCYLKPFKMDGHCTVRDLLFLIFGVEVVSYMVINDGKVSKLDSTVLIVVYVIYLIIQLTDLILMRSTIKNLHLQITTLRQHPISIKRNDKLRKKMALLIALESNEDMRIRKRSDRFYMPTKRKESISSVFFVTPVIKANTNDVDYVSTRTILHDKKNPKNQFLFSEFLQSLNPINRMDWKLSTYIGKFIILSKSPFVFITKIIIPEVNYELHKHGWSKLLNCIQLIITPFIIITIVHSLLENNYSGWHILINYSYSIWSFCLTVPMAIFALYHSRTDIPPIYHSIFLVISSLSSFVVIFMCSNEIEVLTTIVGIVFDLSDNFMDITFGSLINAILDLIAISGATMQGYEKMAFAATFAGPFFSIIMGIAIPLYFNDRVREDGASTWLYGEHGVSCHIFFLIAVVSTLMWCVTLNFHSRRSVGIFCWILLFIFLLFAFGVEFNLIHGFAFDPYYALK